MCEEQQASGNSIEFNDYKAMSFLAYRTGSHDDLLCIESIKFFKNWMNFPEMLFKGTSPLSSGKVMVQVPG